MTEHDRLLEKRARLQALGRELKKLPLAEYHEESGWHVFAITAIVAHCAMLVEASLIREMTT